MAPTPGELPSVTPDSRAASRAALDKLKLDRLQACLAEVLSANAFYRTKLGTGRALPESLAEFASWPVTTKEELVAGAAANGLPANLTHPLSSYVRCHRTSGTHGRPMPVFDTASDWTWWMECWRAILGRAGIGPGDRVLVASSFGPFLGFWSGFDGVLACGAMAIPTGGMSSLARLEMARSLSATVLMATPSYALHLAEVAAEAKLDLASLPIRLVIVAGEPGGSVPAVRDRIGLAWGATVLDHAGASEVGPWGVGDRHGHHLDVLEPWFHPEFLSVETGRPAAPGELAELVLTTLGRVGAPVLRYRTGDLVRPRWPDHAEIDAGESPWVKLEGGVLGRSDDMLVVRGVNVFPAAIDGIVRSFPEVMEYRLTVFSRESLDELALEIEDRLDDPRRVAGELHLRLGLRVGVTAVPAGSLPRFEGKGRRVVDRRRDRGEHSRTHP
jgi:phenylacetate-CoA ligase